MAMTGVIRPGYIQIRVLDMEEAIVHYRDRVGLNIVETADDGRVYFKAYDEFSHHSFILREADEAGFDRYGWKVLDDDTLTSLTQRLVDYGLEVEHVEPGSQPGLGRVVAFMLPSGHRMELFADMEMSDDAPEVVNPNVWQREPHGMAVNRFDHALLYGPEIDEVVKIFVECLDFEIAETAPTPGGPAVWLSCSIKAHDIAFVQIPEPGRFHHVAFFLMEMNDVMRAGDIMAYYDIPIDIGPTRHGITRGHTIYFFDPSGNRNETFSGGYTYYPDNPTRSWEADQIGKGIFYYERQLNEAFLTVYT